MPPSIPLFFPYCWPFFLSVCFRHFWVSSLWEINHWGTSNLTKRPGQWFSGWVFPIHSLQVSCLKVNNRNETLQCLLLVFNKTIERPFALIMPVTCILFIFLIIYLWLTWKCFPLDITNCTKPSCILLLWDFRYYSMIKIVH